MTAQPKQFEVLAQLSLPPTELLGPVAPANHLWQTLSAQIQFTS